MKNLVIGILLTSFAASADPLINLWHCNQFPARPDVSLGVNVTTGGPLGQTTVTVVRSFLGHSKSEAFVVKQMTARDSAVYVDKVTNGNQLYLAIEPMMARENGYAGYLKQGFETTELVCFATK